MIKHIQNILFQADKNVWPTIVAWQTNREFFQSASSWGREDKLIPAIKEALKGAREEHGNDPAADKELDRIEAEFEAERRKLVGHDIQKLQSLLKDVRKITKEPVTSPLFSQPPEGGTREDVVPRVEAIGTGPIRLEQVKNEPTTASNTSQKPELPGATGAPTEGIIYTATPRPAETAAESHVQVNALNVRKLTLDKDGNVTGTEKVGRKTKGETLKLGAGRKNANINGQDYVFGELADGSGWVALERKGGGRKFVDAGTPTPSSEAAPGSRAKALAKKSADGGSSDTQPGGATDTKIRKPKVKPAADPADKTAQDAQGKLDAQIAKTKGAQEKARVAQEQVDTLQTKKEKADAAVAAEPDEKRKIPLQATADALGTQLDAAKNKATELQTAADTEKAEQERKQQDADQAKADKDAAKEAKKLEDAQRKADKTAQDAQGKLDAQIAKTKGAQEKARVAQEQVDTLQTKKEKADAAVAAEPDEKRKIPLQATADALGTQLDAAKNKATELQTAADTEKAEQERKQQDADQAKADKDAAKEAKKLEDAQRKADKTAQDAQGKLDAQIAKTKGAQEKARVAQEQVDTLQTKKEKADAAVAAEPDEKRKIPLQATADALGTQLDAAKNKATELQTAADTEKAEQERKQQDADQAKADKDAAKEAKKLEDAQRKADKTAQDAQGKLDAQIAKTKGAQEKARVAQEQVDTLQTKKEKADAAVAAEPDEKRKIPLQATADALGTQLDAAKNKATELQTAADTEKAEQERKQQDADQAKNDALKTKELTMDQMKSGKEQLKGAVTYQKTFPFDQISPDDATSLRAELDTLDTRLITLETLTSENRGADITEAQVREYYLESIKAFGIYMTHLDEACQRKKPVAVIPANNAPGNTPDQGNGGNGWMDWLKHGINTVTTLASHPYAKLAGALLGLAAIVFAVKKIMDRYKKTERPLLADEERGKLKSELGQKETELKEINEKLKTMDTIDEKADSIKGNQKKELLERKAALEAEIKGIKGALREDASQRLLRSDTLKGIKAELTTVEERIAEIDAQIEANNKIANEDASNKPEMDAANKLLEKEKDTLVGKRNKLKIEFKEESSRTLYRSELRAMTDEELAREHDASKKLDTAMKDINNKLGEAEGKGTFSRADVTRMGKLVENIYDHTLSDHGEQLFNQLGKDITTQKESRTTLEATRGKLDPADDKAQYDKLTADIANIDIEIKRLEDLRNRLPKEDFDDQRREIKEIAKKAGIASAEVDLMLDHQIHPESSELISEERIRRGNPEAIKNEVERLNARNTEIAHRGAEMLTAEFGPSTDPEGKFPKDQIEKLKKENEEFRKLDEEGRKNIERIRELEKQVPAEKKTASESPDAKKVADLTKQLNEAKTQEAEGRAKLQEIIKKVTGKDVKAGDSPDTADLAKLDADAEFKTQKEANEKTKAEVDRLTGELKSITQKTTVIKLPEGVNRVADAEALSGKAQKLAEDLRDFEQNGKRKMAEIEKEMEKIGLENNPERQEELRKELGTKEKELNQLSETERNLVKQRKDLVKDINQLIRNLPGESGIVARLRTAIRQVLEYHPIGQNLVRRWQDFRHAKDTTYESKREARTSLERAKQDLKGKKPSLKLTETTSAAESVEAAHENVKLAKGHIEVMETERERIAREKGEEKGRETKTEKKGRTTTPKI